jgi:hypothetical protein
MICPGNPSGDFDAESGPDLSIQYSDAGVAGFPHLGYVEAVQSALLPAAAPAFELSEQ